MKYHLGKLDSMVKTILSFTEEKPIICGKQATDLRALLIDTKQEAAHIKQYMLEKAFTAKKRKELEVFVQNYQANCIEIADKLCLHSYEIANSTLNNIALKELLGFYDAVLIEIDELLQFIEKRFNTYFDTNQRLPLYYFLRIKHYFHQQLSSIELKLEKNGFDETLKKLVFKYFTTFALAEPDTAYTFKQLIYLRTVLCTLENNADNHLNDSEFSHPIRILFSLDFNCDAFIDYLMECIHKPLSEKDVQNKIQGLLVAKKSLQKLPQSSTVSLYPEKPPVAKKLLTLIDEEVLFLQYELSITHKSPVAEKAVKAFHLNLSVSQIAVLLRIFVDSGIIKTANQSFFLKTIAAFIQTDTSPLISADSLRNKYYSPEKSSALTVKDMLFALIRQINKL